MFTDLSNLAHGFELFVIQTAFTSVALQSPRLRSRMTSNLDDVTVARHPGAIWWCHVATTKDCLQGEYIISVVTVYKY